MVPVLTGVVEIVEDLSGVRVVGVHEEGAGRQRGPTDEVVVMVGCLQLGGAPVPGVTEETYNVLGLHETEDTTTPAHVGEPKVPDTGNTTIDDG